MKAMLYRVNNYRWKAGYLQKKGVVFWRNVAPCPNWLDAVWAINCIGGLHQQSTFESYKY
jgi:hypothetical protein